jgi:hypothetical protein
VEGQISHYFNKALRSRQHLAAGARSLPRVRRTDTNQRRRPG